MDCNDVGYAQHGHCEEAFEVFHQMQRVGMKHRPDYLHEHLECMC